MAYVDKQMTFLRVGFVDEFGQGAEFSNHRGVGKVQSHFVAAMPDPCGLKRGAAFL